MKRKIISILFALVLVLSFSLVTAAPVGANADRLVPSGYATIQLAIDAADSGDTIIVAAGTRAPFTVDAKTNLTIQADGAVIVEGAQLVTTAYTGRGCVVFVNDSTNIVLDGLDIEGLNLAGTGDGGKNYGVIYENSSGEIKDCTVSPNTVGDMNSVAIGIWDGSTVTVAACTIHNFGRVGMLIYNACTVEVLGSTIEGQVYSGEGEVCYGIEVEGVMSDATAATASQVTIRGNEIYNCDNTFYEAPTWQSGGVYINGWLEYYPEADSTVIVENNDIHDNYSGIIVIKSSLSSAQFNNIYGNRAFGVESLAAHDDSTAVFDAENNWWGATDGPSLSPGAGDKVSENVDYDPWLDSPFQESGGAVSMTAASEEAFIGISVSPTSIDFGAVTSGATVPGSALTVFNTGNVSITIDAEIIADTFFNVGNTEYFYTAALRLSGGPSDKHLTPTSFGSWVLIGSGKPLGEQPIEVGGSRPLTTGLQCPPEIKAATTYTGTVVFWAEQAAP